MRITTLAGARAAPGEPPRATAYYYADLERLKRKAQDQIPKEEAQNADELSEYVESNEVINDGAVREVPPFRDRQWSLPEYSTPDNPRKVPEETYSTAGTFPMPEQKEKEPLLAELEVVGRLPLTQLDSASGVRRSRSWYLCCPNVADEEISRESSWRYSSLRPVTAPPLPGQNGINVLVTTQSSGREDVTSLRAERDALARALAAERQRAAAASRAHDARLAELHGVIAELVRRRAADKHARAIPEEEVSDECESTTQPAGELDNDADRSRTEQNDTSSAPSPGELPTPQDRGEPRELPDDTTDTSENRLEQPRVELTPPPAHPAADNCDVSLNLSERDSEICLSTARCCQYARHAASAGGSCEREHGSADGRRVYAPSPGRCEPRQAKVASRVRLRRTEHEEGRGDGHGHGLGDGDELWAGAAALALDVCAQADLREALVTAANDGSALSASVSAWRARCARLQADCGVLQCALARAADTAHRLYSSCAVQESCSVAVCGALLAADRALEAYDVLLALAEAGQRSPEREAAELVARQLLARLDAEQSAAAIGQPLLSPGPWLQHDAQVCAAEPWSAALEASLRAHAARLKAETVSLRSQQPPPAMFSYHDVDEEELPHAAGAFSMADMEAAVVLQEVLSAREAAALARAGPRAARREPASHAHLDKHYKSESRRGRRSRERHWLETQASETDL